jgi:mono/diheme cytochrome c family protein
MRILGGIVPPRRRAFRSALRSMPATTLGMRTLLGVVAVLASAVVVAQPAPKTSQSLGELLYSTHCAACHTTEVHWREKRLATDWASLRAQVARWQSNSGLAWRDTEIIEVTRYLNGRYYHFPEPGHREVSLRSTN